jgi:hypothetical protein
MLLLLVRPSHEVSATDWWAEVFLDVDDDERWLERHSGVQVARWWLRLFGSEW